MKAVAVPAVAAPLVERCAAPSITAVSVRLDPPSPVAAPAPIVDGGRAEPAAALVLPVIAAEPWFGPGIRRAAAAVWVLTMVVLVANTIVLGFDSWATGAADLTLIGLTLVWFATAVGGSGPSSRPSGSQQLRSPELPVDADPEGIPTGSVPGAGLGADLQQAILGVVDLERRVVDPEALAEQLLELAPGGVAVGVALDEDMGRERREARADLPDVQVVHLGDAGVLGHRVADLLDVELGRGHLEQHPARGAQEPDRGAQHQRGDEERGDRVGAVEPVAITITPATAVAPNA